MRRGLRTTYPTASGTVRRYLASPPESLSGPASPHPGDEPGEFFRPCSCISRSDIDDFVFCSYRSRSASRLLTCISDASNQSPQTMVHLTGGIGISCPPRLVRALRPALIPSHVRVGLAVSNGISVALQPPRRDPPNSL